MTRGGAITRRRLLALAGAAVTVSGLSHAEAATASPPHAGPDPNRTRLRYVEVNGALLAYRRHGRAGRPRLLVVHGYALNSTGPIYQPLIERLTADFEVWALDLRGHGGSAASVANWSLATIADDVAGFAHQMNLRGATYAGHSLGGFTGLYAQIRHPGTFSALALLATASAGGNAASAAAAELFARDGRDRATMAATFRGMYMRPRSEDLEQAAAAIGLIDPAVHRANSTSTIISDRLNEIQVPVLLVNGARDTVVSPADQHRTATGLRQAKEVILSSEGHMLPIERPEATAREITAFFLHDIRDVFPPGMERTS